MATKVLRFTQLEAWKKAHQAVLNVYRITRGFPPEERFVLATQFRKAAVSIPANIAEGSARKKAADKAHFYTMARSSAEELRYYFILAADLEYVTPEAAGAADHALDEVCRMLHGMTVSMESRLCDKR